MSIKIAKLLDQAEEVVSDTINKLESAHGFTGEDARLIAENSQAVRQRLLDLGLDPNDTTPNELFHALDTRYREDCQKFDQSLGINSSTSREQLLETAIGLAEHCLEGQNILAMKSADARKALGQVRPVRTRRLFGFRSVDSMLKRGNLAAIYACLSLESISWQRKLATYIKKLGPAVFELRPPIIVTLDNKLVIPADDNAVQVSKYYGSIGVFPPQEDLNMTVLSLTLEVLAGAESLTGKSSLDRVIKVHPALYWWQSTDHLSAWLDDQVISLNLFDVAANSPKNNYEKRTYQRAASGFWQKLLERYASLKAAPDTGLVLSDEIDLPSELRSLTNRQIAAQELVTLDGDG